MKRSIVAAAFTFALTASALAQIPNADEIVRKAAWDDMEIVTVELLDHHFVPKDLKLKAGVPYRIILKNTGEQDHFYTAAEFFKEAVAWRKVQVPRPGGGEIRAPYFTAIEAYKKGGQIELFLVPVKKGTYNVVCTIGDHEEKGMTGTITVE
ncbi:MAG: cupredoxin domain-containing protein [Rhodoferax sp.]|nr:cupredoxin domain-containing protein [Rhodoferax sp.]